MPDMKGVMGVGLRVLHHHPFVPGRTAAKALAELQDAVDDPLGEERRIEIGVQVRPVRLQPQDSLRQVDLLGNPACKFLGLSSYGAPVTPWCARGGSLKAHGRAVSPSACEGDWNPLGWARRGCLQAGQRL